MARIQLPLSASGAPRRGWLAALLCLLISACTTLPKDLLTPRVTLVDIRLKDYEPLRQRFHVVLGMHNPNNMRLTVKKTTLVLELDSRTFATVASRQEVILPSRGDALLKTDVSTRLSDWFIQLQHMQQAKALRFHYRLEGEIHLAPDDLRLPIEEEGEVSLEGMLDQPVEPPPPVPSTPRPQNRPRSSACATAAPMPAGL